MDPSAMPPTGSVPPDAPAGAPTPPLFGPDTALFLDVDGTLIEIAATPDLVLVPTELPPLLGALAGKLGGAVALVTGRALDVARALIPTPGLFMGCEHGAVLYPPDPAAPPLPVPAAEWRALADDFAAAHPGCIAEHKTHGLVLHFRLNPDAADEARANVQAMADTDPEIWRAVPAHAAIELRPRMADKGHAVKRLMTVAAFAGRKPIFIGDDVTDEDGIAAAYALGGVGYRMPEDFVAGPSALRDWLARAERALP